MITGFPGFPGLTINRILYLYLIAFFEVIYVTSPLAVNPAYTWVGHYHGDVISPVSNTVSSSGGDLTFPEFPLFISGRSQAGWSEVIFVQTIHLYYSENI